MSIALDIGTSRLRSLRREGEELVGRSVPAMFALVADEPSARSLLDRSQIPFAAGDGELALIGDAALMHAAAFRAIAMRLMPGGLVPTDDPPARQLIATLIDSLLPDSLATGQTCGLILPAAMMADDASAAFLVRLIQLRGYDPICLSAGQATALATLSSEGFTGLALSFGAGGCSLSLVRHGSELAEAALPGGTDMIDARLAAAARCYTHDSDGTRCLDVESIRRQRESLSDPLTRPTTDFAAQVAEQYREVLLRVVKDLARQIEDRRLGAFTTPVPVVCAGGGARPAGFGGLMTAALAAIEMPLPIGPVRLAPASDYLVARGGLIHAELESTCSAAA